MAASQALLVLASDRGESVLEHVFSGAMPAGTLVGRWVGVVRGCQTWLHESEAYAWSPSCHTYSGVPPRPYAKQMMPHCAPWPHLLRWRTRRSELYSSPSSGSSNPWPRMSGPRGRAASRPRGEGIAAASQPSSRRRRERSKTKSKITGQFPQIVILRTMSATGGATCTPRLTPRPQYPPGGPSECQSRPFRNPSL